MIKVISQRAMHVSSLVTTDALFQQQMLKHCLGNGAGLQSRAGVIEVNQIAASGRVTANLIQINRHDCQASFIARPWL
jgi:hypothetical protein